MEAKFPCTLLVDLPNWLGDLVHTMPALATLAAANRDGRTIGVSPPTHAPLLRLCGVEVLGRPRGVGWLWARRHLSPRIAVALSARHATRAKLLLAASGAPLRLASRGRGAGLLGLDVFTVDRDRHQRHDLDRALTRLGLAPVEEAAFHLRLPERLLEKGRQRRRDLSEAPTLVAFLPGARAMPAKRYPATSFRQVARALADAGAAVVVVIGPSERALGEAVAGAGGAAALVGADLPLDQVAALLATCDAAVGNDSGLTHLAAVSGCPTVTLFGPTDPVRTAPVGGGIVLRAPRRALTELPPAQVAATLMTLLAGRPGWKIGHDS
jgi:lipopolysaccharide heptosyltransferase II